MRYEKIDLARPTALAIALAIWAATAGLPAARAAAPDADAPPPPPADARPDQPPPPPPDAQDADAPRPDASGGGGGGASRPRRPNLQRTIDGLNLSPDQRGRVDKIVRDFEEQQRQAREAFHQQMSAVLTPEQYATFAAAERRQGPPPPQGPPQGTPRNDRDADAPPATRPAAAAPADGDRVPVTLTGGHETDGRDRGRPVVLIAAALGVTPEVFRDAFGHVTPAGPGQQPEEAQVRRNKQALMSALSPRGVTDERLSEVSNYYRYNRSARRTWKQSPAVAYAIVRHGVVTSIAVADAGAGYTTPPDVTVDGVPDFHATAKLAFGTDLATNGSIREITIDPPGGAKAAGG